MRYIGRCENKLLLSKFMYKVKRKFLRNRAIRRIVCFLGRLCRNDLMISIGDQYTSFYKFGWETVSNVQPADHIVNIKSECLPFKDKSVSSINASHVIEHLRDHELEHFLKETYRVLCINGVLRIVIPDLALFINSYQTDSMVLHYERILEPGLTMRAFLEQEIIAGRQDPDVLHSHNGLISIVASYTNGHPLPVADKETVDILLKNNSVDNFVRWCVSLKDDSKEDFGHFNGFDYNRIECFLMRAGFKSIHKSTFGALEHGTRFRGIDRPNKQHISLYVNSEKT